MFNACSTTKIVCRPNCPPGRRTKPENRRSFPTLPDAYNAGYRACLVCHPDVGPPGPWKSKKERLAALKATRAGRISLAGYNYQCAYAVARLAAMGTAHPVLLQSDYPKRLRYDWGEDLDELLNDGSVCFTQCKRVDDIGKPAKLAQVLMGFAPKWLWTPEAKRTQIRFRLVSCDPRFLRVFQKDTERDAVLVNFKSQLAAAPTPQSDRAKWRNEADSVGPEQLFDALWQTLDLVHLAKDVVPDDPTGSLLPAERAALDHLMARSVIWGDTQKDALARLKRTARRRISGHARSHPSRTKRHPSRARCSSLGAILRQMHVAPANSGSQLPKASIVNQPS